MSEQNNNPSNVPGLNQPIKKTSAVPLRKETVRVTLKAPGAKPGGAPAGVEPPVPSEAPAAPPVQLSSDAQPTKSLASPTSPMSAPTSPMTPPSPSSVTPSGVSGGVNSKVDLPGVTSAVPLKQETMRVTLKADGDGAPPAPALTIPLGGAAKPLGAAMATPAPTMKLGGTGTTPLNNQPLTTPIGLASQPLPKATVQLQQTQQLTQGLGRPAQAASIQTVGVGDEAQRSGSGAALPLSIVAFALSLVVLYFQFSHAKLWVDEHEGEDIGKIFEANKVD